MRYLCKILVLAVGVISFMQADILYAQNPTEPRVFSYNVRKSPTVGFKGGVLLSTVTGDEAIDPYAKRIGPQLGVSGAVYVHPMLSIRAELNYEAKGGKFANHDMKMNLNYATLPVYLKFNFTRDPEIFIYAGGYASYLFSAKTTGKYEVIIGEDFTSETINEDILENMTNYDVGMVAGLGVQGRFNRYADIFLDFRYTQGFIVLDNKTADLRYNFNHEDFWPIQDIDKPKNKAIMFTAGFIIYLIPR